MAYKVTRNGRPYFPRSLRCLTYLWRPVRPYVVRCHSGFLHTFRHVQTRAVGEILCVGRGCAHQAPESVVGQKQKSDGSVRMSALPPTPEVKCLDVCFWSNSGHRSGTLRLPGLANTGHSQTPRITRYAVISPEARLCGDLRGAFPDPCFVCLSSSF